MNKNQLFVLTIVLLLTAGASATNIIKSPGSTTDVFSELPIKASSNADTLFIEGGSEDIFLKAGPTDDGAPYAWSTGTGSETTYTITFKFTQTGNITTSKGYVGQHCSVSRVNPAETQYLWVFYKGIPLKPTTPSGQVSVCLGSNSSYTTTSTNATSFEWTLDPLEAGTLANESTNSPNITWSSTYLGQASLRVKGINGNIIGVSSDAITITINATPQKPEIDGDSFVKKTTSLLYKGISLGATNWTWTLNPLTGIATSTPNGSQTSLNFMNTGNLVITLQTQNSCGTSSLSDPLEIEIIDPSVITTLNEQVTNLTNENALLNSENSKLIDDNNDLKIQVGTLSTEVTDLTNENETLTIKNSDLVVAVENQKLEISELESQIDELTKLNSSLQTDIETLTFLNDYLQTENDKLNTTNQTQLTELELLRKVYILKWTVESVTTQVFETTVGKFSVSLYPNPSPGEINIDCTETMKDIKILNLQGQILKTLTINGTSTKFTVNRSEMPAGTYLIRITTNKGVATHKVIINPK